MSKNICVLLTGSGASGKNTIIDELRYRDEDIDFVISNTTREKRERDKKVKKYNFISKAKFEKLIDKKEMLEYDVFAENYYGVPKSALTKSDDRNKILMKDLTISGVINCKELLADDFDIHSVFLKVPKKVIIQRLIDRGSRSEIKYKMKEFKKENKRNRIFDYIILNINFEKTIEIMTAINNRARNNMPLLCVHSTQSINNDKVLKYEKKFLKSKKRPILNCIAHNACIYVIDDANKFLALSKNNISPTLKFSNNELEYDNENNDNEWVKILENVKNN